MTTHRATPAHLQLDSGSGRHPYITTDPSAVHGTRLLVREAEYRPACDFALAIATAPDARATARALAAVRTTLSAPVRFGLLARECRHWTPSLVGAMARNGYHRQAYTRRADLMETVDTVRGMAVDLLLETGSAGAFWMIRSLVAPRRYDDGAVWSALSAAEIARLAALVCSDAPNGVAMRTARRTLRYGVRDVRLSPALRAAEILLLAPNTPSAVLRDAFDRVLPDRAWLMARAAGHPAATSEIWERCLASFAALTGAPCDTHYAQERLVESLAASGALAHESVRTFLLREGGPDELALLLTTAATDTERRAVLSQLMVIAPERALTLLSQADDALFAVVTAHDLLPILEHTDGVVRTSALGALAVVGTETPRGADGGRFHTTWDPGDDLPF